MWLVPWGSLYLYSDSPVDSQKGRKKREVVPDLKPRLVGVALRPYVYTRQEGVRIPITAILSVGCRLVLGLRLRLLRRLSTSTADQNRQSPPYQADFNKYFKTPASSSLVSTMNPPSKSSLSFSLPAHSDRPTSKSTHSFVLWKWHGPQKPSSPSLVSLLMSPRFALSFGACAERETTTPTARPGLWVGLNSLAPY